MELSEEVKSAENVVKLAVGENIYFRSLFYILCVLAKIIVALLLYIFGPRHIDLVKMSK